ncbi:MAG TPA: PDZ domain-containing protein [Pyrinomonadaceae bacterium]|nr:PDZ domain-containing protein [Pyrinomonadaceae bacterium]
MRIRNLLMLSAILLFVSTCALAQSTAPLPSTPPDDPSVFSFYFDGSNYLGILPEEINSSNMSKYGLSQPRGVGISRVTAGSPAEKAGLKKGDVILQFDNEAVTSTRKLFRLIGEAAPEQTVRLTISRNGSEQQVTVTLSQREGASRALRALSPGQRGNFSFNLPRTPVAPGQNAQPFTFNFGNRRVGITSTALTKQLADYFGVSSGHGLLVTSVTENSPASKAGLRAGDVITEVNGERVEGTQDFIRAINRKEDGEVTLTIVRERSKLTIKLTPERRPASNFSLAQPFPSVSQISIPEINVEIPAMRLQAMPRINIPVMPKIEIPVMPRIELQTLPRIMEKLQRIEKLQIPTGVI